MALRGGTVLAASICLLAAPAAAQETYRLDYVREPGTEICPNEAVFRAAVSREVGRDPFQPDAPNLLTVVFRRSEKNVRVQIVAKSISGAEQRAPEHEKPTWQCAGLLHHAAFSAGMLIEPLEPPEPEPHIAPPTPPAPPALPAPSLPPSSPPPPPTAAQTVRAVPLPRPGPPTRILISFAGGAASGSTPTWSPSLVFGLGLRQAELSLGVEIRYDAESERIEEPYRIRGSQRFGMLIPCQHARVRSWLQLDKCILISVGYLDRSIEHDSKVWNFLEEKPTFTWGVGLRGGLSFPLGQSVTLQTRLDILFVPDPPEEIVLDREIWTYPYASAALQVGLVYAFDVTNPTAKPPPPPPPQKFSPTVGTSGGSDDI
ncbi:hypothetical protein [Polyangium jinanense]|uniref:Outer membrane protein beta-barrel domain-containing protein n=1 Tax=Polyangium jinanense TaxID=2829994 RepID=A0A9X4AT28_9BACT|nr:hypothetical protein [Polyangium jinanense]MDC3955486.1 hypothetical protein [Polyangium jinanense]MDC3981787.1 hypothetical protein [Polyangium jinanense]